MTTIIKKEDFILKENFFLSELKKGKIFILPTDTVYGLCCISTDKKAIEKIYKIKKRDLNKPLSLIVPNRFWAFKNCKIRVGDVKMLFKIPKEKLTLVFRLKKKNDISKTQKIINKNDDTIGIRIIDFFTQKFVKKLKVPIVATSLNLSSKVPVSNISKLDENIKKRVDYILDIGILGTKSSKVYNLTK